MLARAALDVFLADVERRAVSVFLSHSQRGAAESALAKALLRETVSGLRGSSPLLWAGFAGPPYSAASWLLAGVSEEDVQPLEAVLPTSISEALIAGWHTVAAERPSQKLAFRRVEGVPSGPSGWTLGQHVTEYYRTPVQVGLSGEAPDLRGLVVMAASADLGPRVVDLESALQHSVDAMVDRLRWAHAGRANYQRILASVDDEYQESLIRARRADGLQGFLSDLQSDSRETTPRRVHGEPGTADEHPPSSRFAMDEVRALFGQLLEETRPKGPKKRAVLQLAPEQGPLLLTTAGSWHGRAQYRFGIGELRSRDVLLALVEDHVATHHYVANFIRRCGANSNEYSLALIAPAGYAAVREVACQWADIIDVVAGNLSGAGGV